MGDKNDGGPAFPLETTASGVFFESGMSLRDYFAAAATEEDIREYMPKTVGEVADLMLRLGWITPYAFQQGPLRAYGDKEKQRLRVWAKFQHADAMLAERDK